MTTSKKFFLNNYRANTWCFTIQNYDEEVEQKLYDIFQKLQLKYMIYGREIASTTGTRHLQGYFRGLLCYRKTISAAGTFTHSTRGPMCIWSYLMPAKGTEEDNWKYCTKSGDYVEIGQKIKSLEEKIKRDKKWAQMKEDCLKMTVENFSDKYPRESVIYRNQLKNWETDLTVSN